MKNLSSTHKEKLLMRVCHCCQKLNESDKELERCMHCNKAFLPLRYFEKVHSHQSEKWESHFSKSEELNDEDLIKGLFVLW